MVSPESNLRKSEQLRVIKKISRVEFVSDPSDETQVALPRQQAALKSLKFGTAKPGSPYI